jgi:hypothetical protein
MPEFKIWYRNDWYQHWPGPSGAVPTPNPTTTFGTFAEAMKIAEDNQLYGARIYRLMAEPEGSKFKLV